MHMGWAALGLGRRAEARRLFGETLESLVDAAATSHDDFATTLSGIALASELIDVTRAARLLGATERLRERSEYSLSPDYQDLERFFE